MEQQSENAPIVVTLKAGKGYDDPWIVLRADAPEQMAAALDAAEKIAHRVCEANETLAKANSETRLMSRQLGAKIVPNDAPNKVKGAANAADVWSKPAPDETIVDKVLKEISGAKDRVELQKVWSSHSEDVLRDKKVFAAFEAKGKTFK